MKATFTTTKKGTWAYICKSVRVNGKSTSVTVRKLGLLSDIQREHGCSDPRQWVRELAVRMTQEEKEGAKAIELPFHPSRLIPEGGMPLRVGGDLLLLPIYSRLGLGEACDGIMRGTRAKYDLAGILRTLVMGRVLYPGSKARTFHKSRELVDAPSFSEEEMYRALSLLSGHIDDLQARVYSSSTGILPRRDRIIYYDCTNYYFETEDNDKDGVDCRTGEFLPGLRKRGKSKEHRPNPIVQMGMFMDMDGIPLAFVVFPGNESEQTTLRPLEEVLDRKFGLTDFIVSTDAGLGSEDNRRYNMAEGRDYICVQSIPSLKARDRSAAIDPRGWRLAHCRSNDNRVLLEKEWSDDGVFDLSAVLGDKAGDAAMLRGATFYKEILVDKSVKYENPAWLSANLATRQCKPRDAGGKPIPHYLTSVRRERVIVTYSHDFALYLKHKRAERLSIARKMVASGRANARRSQQSPLNYIETIHTTRDGTPAVRTEMVIKDGVLEQEEALDGFYAYATSMEDEAPLVLRARSFHHEIEHLFRTTKTHLDARPVYLSRQDRIKSHFLICFLAMVLLKILQKQVSDAYPDAYRDNPLSIDRLIETLRDFRFAALPNHNFMPAYKRTELTDQLQALANIEANNEIISAQRMRRLYKKVKRC